MANVGGRQWSSNTYTPPPSSARLTSDVSLQQEKHKVRWALGGLNSAKTVSKLIGWLNLPVISHRYKNRKFTGRFKFYMISIRTIRVFN